MTLGAMCLVLAFAERPPEAVGRVLVTYGRAPLFFYVAHWYVLHVMALAASIWMGASWREFDFARNFAGLPRPLDFTLDGVYGVAAAAVALLYLPWGWVGAFKRRSRAPWARFV
jgi:hypothetical protein